MWNTFVDFGIWFGGSALLTALVELRPIGRLLLCITRWAAALLGVSGVLLYFIAFRPEGWGPIAFELGQPLLGLRADALCSFAGALAGTVLVQIFDRRRMKR